MGCNFNIMKEKIENYEMHWHSCPYEAVLQNLQSSKDGLSLEEAALRLKKFGLNRLAMR